VPTGRITRRSPVRRAGAVTTRAAVLAVVLCALVLSLTYPVRSYFAQRAEIRDLERAKSVAQARVAALEAREARWKDPAYVEAQARARLRYVRPGETSYIVIAPTPTAAPTTPARRKGAAADQPWYERVWETVEVAGEEPTAGPER
jgi:cell division protein FtsB